MPTQAELEQILHKPNTDLIVIPEGEYEIDSGISIDYSNRNSLRIIGEGRVNLHSTVAELDGFPSRTFDYNTALKFTGDPTTSISIENINVTHTPNVRQQPEYRGTVLGLSLFDFEHVTLRKVAASGFTHYGLAVVHCQSGHVMDCSSTSNRYAGLGVIGSSNIEVLRGEYSQNGYQGIDPDGRFAIEGYGITTTAESSDAIDSRNVSVRETNCRNNIGKGIDAHNCDGFLVDSNVIEGFGGDGVYAVCEPGRKTVRNVIIRNNHILAGGGFPRKPFNSGIQIGAHSQTGHDTEPGFFVVTQNVIQRLNPPDYKGYGIHVYLSLPYSRSPEMINISGNTIDTCGPLNSGIHVSDDYDPQSNVPHSVTPWALAISDNTIEVQASNAIQVEIAEYLRIRGNIIVAHKRSDGPTVAISVNTYTYAEILRNRGHVDPGGIPIQDPNGDAIKSSNDIHES